MWLFLLLCFMTVFIGTFRHMVRNFNFWRKCGVAEVTPTPLFGNLWSCVVSKKSFGQRLHDLYKLGAGHSYIGLYIFDKPGLLIRDPDFIKTILFTDFFFFQDRYATASPDDHLGGCNLFFLKHPSWKLVRNKLNPVYSSIKLRRMFELFVEVGNDLAEFMENLKLEGEGKTLELCQITSKFIADFNAVAGASIKPSCLKDPNSEMNKVNEKYMAPSFLRSIVLRAMFFGPWLVKTLNLKFFPKAAENYIRETIWGIINERERLEFRKEDLIDHLLELRKIEKEDDKRLGYRYKDFEFDGDKLIAQAAISVGSIFKISATVISFTLYELALNPEIQSKAREEILNSLQNTGGKIDYIMLIDLPYLDKCVNETLRKYPPIPFLDRVSTEFYKMPDSNLVLERGTPVFISVSALHYDPEYFPDPYKYDPERFSEANKKTRKPFSYLPFGEGPHLCIGMKLGLLQVKLALVNLLSAYEFSPCEKTEVPVKLSAQAITTCPVNGIHLNVKKFQVSEV